MFFKKGGDLYFLLLPHFSWVLLRSYLLGALESRRWVTRAFCTLGIIAFQEKVLGRGAWWATVQEVAESDKKLRLTLALSLWEVGPRTPEFQSWHRYCRIVGIRQLRPSLCASTFSPYKVTPVLSLLLFSWWHSTLLFAFYMHV